MAKPKSMVVSDMMKVTFDDKTFKESITPVFYQMLQPMIENTIHVSVTIAVEAAVTGLQTTVIKDTIQSNQSTTVYEFMTKRCESYVYISLPIYA